MNRPMVNLGAGGFVSYFEDGGATVSLDPYEGINQEFSSEPQYEEQGIATVITDKLQSSLFGGPDPVPTNEIRKSGRTNAENRDVYYPEGQTFFERLATDYDYPVDKLEDGAEGIAPLMGRNRMGVPRSDLPKAQELEDARAHMLASAMAASAYGPETAKNAGDRSEDIYFFGSNTENAIMDKRNNAIGIDIFKKAGINATTAQLTQMVDIRVFEQLNAILGRTSEEQGPPTSRPNWPKNFSSPETGPDLYFPRKDSGKFIEDKNY